MADKIDFPDCEVEFGQAHSHCSGKLCSLKLVRAEVERRAKELWIQDVNGEMADRLKNLAQWIGRQVDEKSAELQQYIDECVRRAKIRNASE